VQSVADAVSVPRRFSSSGRTVLHLFDVEGVEADLDPPIPEVGGPGHPKRVGLRGDERLAFLLREGEAHDRLVPGNGGVDGLADPELHPVAHDRLVRTGERGGDGSGVVDRHPIGGAR
jgi:hypothetical protein